MDLALNSNGMIVGTIKFFSPLKGFGFVDGGGVSQDVFVMRKELNGVCVDKGDMVEYIPQVFEKGIQATHIRVLGPPGNLTYLGEVKAFDPATYEAYLSCKAFPGQDIYVPASECPFYSTPVGGFCTFRVTMQDYGLSAHKVTIVGAASERARGKGDNGGWAANYKTNWFAELGMTEEEVDPIMVMVALLKAKGKGKKGQGMNAIMGMDMGMDQGEGMGQSLASFMGMGAGKGCLAGQKGVPCAGKGFPGVWQSQLFQKMPGSDGSEQISVGTEQISVGVQVGDGIASEGIGVQMGDSIGTPLW